MDTLKRWARYGSEARLQADGGRRLTEGLGCEAVWRTAAQLLWFTSALGTATLAYQHDPLPELGAEFGHSQLWAFALGFAF